MAKTSAIKITEIAKGKKKLKQKKTDVAIDLIIKKMKDIQQEFDWTAKYYDRMLKKGGADGEALSTDSLYYSDIKQIHDKTAKRSTYCTNRVNNLNNLYHQDVGDEANFMAKRIADLEKQVANMKKQSKEDSDAK